ncbi:uncharacterized protein PFL1_05745 [Pseudozyma flocculosa PF-1]|uniref:Related to NADPH-dependent beta- ketoacyl reductase n=2 Tax=Pseudozyma flocculosa TaxID=84751 RepID=A0A5C3F8Z1_9BASI|nr:uncharacterized protein PFL1_05745 [Pseudozyma flocculosa PF-1]EPQ26766.1 hypothetical protein PFL1_05745 [Pseudozyma flocculosa PF-1]SPO40908.1 related to NADPH-dependent beta- ketoacyl reductase [Pseudozyma flocculosa]
MTSATAAPLAHLEAHSLFSVDGLVVVITGGSAGLGLYSAHTLAHNGATVYILGRDPNRLDDVVSAFPKLASGRTGAPRGRIEGVQADTTDKQSLADAVAAIRQKQPAGIDALICNAGIGGRFLQSYGTDSVSTDPSRFDDMLAELSSFSFQEAQRVLDVNILGTYFTALAFLPLLKKRADAYLDQAAGNRGAVAYSPQVILTSSNAAWAKTPILNPIYNISKTACSHLAKMLSTLLAETNIRVNTLEPGLYPSDLTSNEAKDPVTGHSTLSHTNGADIPAGRCGRPAEHGATVLYLVSRAALFANGATLRIDGGALNRIPGAD